MNRSIIRRLANLSSAVFVTAVLARSGGVAAAENDDFRFAQRLQRDGMFIAAAEEYQRFSEKYPESPLRPVSLFNAGESWMRAARAAEALAVFESLLTAYPSDENACKARYYRGDILRAMKKYREAADEFMMIEDAFPGCPLKGRALLGAGESLIAAGDSPAAAAVLRRLSETEKDDEVLPRAMFSLAVALDNIGRDLEAGGVLETLVSKHPESPVSALALLRLGDGAVAAGDLGKGVEYYRKAADRHKEKSLRERSILKLIETLERSGAMDEALKESSAFLGEFPESAGRPVVYRRAIDSARHLGRHDRALELIESWRAEGAVPDSTGEISLLKARILTEKGRDGEARSELAPFRHTWPSSPLLPEALLLEAGLLRRSGAGREAAGRLHLALLEEKDEGKRAAILSSLASICAEDLGDTLSAIMYWEKVASIDRTGLESAEALWKAGLAREMSGDIRGASGNFGDLLARFPENPRAEEASGRLERIALRGAERGDAVAELARVLTADSPPQERGIEAGVILLETADRPEEAASYFERSLKGQLPEPLAARAAYYLGNARHRQYELSVASGKPDRDLLSKALSQWLKVARESVGTEWGSKAHINYIESRMSDWNDADKLQKIDEFLQYYAKMPEKWRALALKSELLFDAASAGREGAAGSALALCEEIEAGDAPEEIRKDALLRSGYLRKLSGDMAGSVGDFRAFAGRYGGDGRVASVLFDLGETLFAMKDYGGALEAWTSCMGKNPPRSLAAKCALRIGDCRYYTHDFASAAAVFGGFAGLYPESGLIDEAAYRQSLALERLGRFDSSDSILVELERKKGVAPGLRARMLSRLSQRLRAKGRAADALPLLGELVSLDRTHENLSAWGEALFETGDFKQSEKIFSEALRHEGADSCRIVAGRAMARVRLGEAGKAREDMGILIASNPGCGRMAAVLLEQGMAEAGAERCADAVAILAGLRERFPGTAEAATALYHMAVCDIKRGGYAEAIDRLNAFLREMPRTPILDQVYFKLASARYASKNPGLAAVDYGLAAEASRDDALIFLALKNRAMIYQELEEWDKASEGWYAICERYPGRDDIVELFFNLGFCYGQAGKYEMAREVYLRIPGVARDEEQQGRAHYWAGVSLKSMGRYDEAVREFLRVPYLKTGGMWGVTSKLEAADCYEKMGQRQQAEDIYRRILEAHGEGSDWGSLARKALERMNAPAAGDDESGRWGSGDPGASPGREE